MDTKHTLLYLCALLVFTTDGAFGEKPGESQRPNVLFIAVDDLND